jgi:hypothetical protein
MKLSYNQGFVGTMLSALVVSTGFNCLTMDDKFVKQSVNGMEYELMMTTESKDFRGCNISGKGNVVITTNTDYFSVIGDKEPAVGVGSLVDVPCNQYNLQTGEKLNGN